MARNLKRENLIKLSKIESNGYKVDITNYMKNPSFRHEYPSLVKRVNDTEDKLFFKNIYYFKFHDGNGEYRLEEYSMPKNSENQWQVLRDVKETVLEESNRFSMKKLEQFALTF